MDLMEDVPVDFQWKMPCETSKSFLQIFRKNKRKDQPVFLTEVYKAERKKIA